MKLKLRKSSKTVFSTMAVHTTHEADTHRQSPYPTPPLCPSAPAPPTYPGTPRQCPLAIGAPSPSTRAPRPTPRPCERPSARARGASPRGECARSSRRKAALRRPAGRPRPARPIDHTGINRGGHARGPRQAPPCPRRRSPARHAGSTKQRRRPTWAASGSAAAPRGRRAPNTAQTLIPRGAPGATAMTRVSRPHTLPTPPPRNLTRAAPRRAANRPRRHTRGGADPMDEEAAASSKRQRTPRKEGAPPRMEGTGSANPRRAKSRIKLYEEPGPKRVIGEDAGTTRDERRTP